MKAEDFHKYLTYNPETGSLIWKPRPSEWFSSANSARTWNTRYAHQVAGTVGFHGYRYVNFFRRKYQAHRIIITMESGSEPPEEVDHINGQRDDNRLANLRSVTRSQNRMNSSLSRRSSTGVKGVKRRTDCDRWEARVRDPVSKEYVASLHTTFEEATRVVALRRIELHGEFANHG